MDPSVLTLVQQAVQERVSGLAASPEIRAAFHAMTKAELKQARSYFSWMPYEARSSADKFLEELWHYKRDLLELTVRAGLLEESKFGLASLASKGDWHTMRLLVQIGARNGHQSLVEFMLTVYDDHLEVAPVLVTALQGHHLALATYLLNHYSDIESYQAFQEAVKSGQLELLQLLLQHYPRPETGGHLEVACEQNDLPMVQLLLQHGAVATASCLREAAKHGNLELVELLQTHGAQDFYGHALVEATSSRKLELLQTIYSRRQPCPVNVADHALLKAVTVPQQSAELVQQLLNWGAVSLNAALQGAAKHGNLEVVKLLLDRGATELREASKAAAENGHLEVVKLLRAAGANDLEAMLMSAICSSNLELTQYLLKEGADNASEAIRFCFCNRRYRQGFFLTKYVDPKRVYYKEEMLEQTILWSYDTAAVAALLAWHRPRRPEKALMTAANEAHLIKMVELLLSFYPEVTSAELQWPLLVAIRSKNAPGARLLLKAGAEPPTEGADAVALEKLLA